MVETINKLIRVSRQLLAAVWAGTRCPRKLPRRWTFRRTRCGRSCKIAQEPVSLETPIGEEEDSHLGDFIPDDDAPAPAEAAVFHPAEGAADGCAGHADPAGGKGASACASAWTTAGQRTLEEVGKEFNVTRERIRQIEAKALRKLRHPSRSKKLKDFLD